MTICPSCGTENIEGVDECDECGQSLADMHLDGPLLQVERSLLTDRVGLLGPKTPITVAADTPVQKVLRMMVDRSIGCLIVVRNDEPVGIFSERDALFELNVDAKELGDQPVGKYMTSNPQTLQESAKIAFAVHRMDLGGYRHIPIVGENGHLTGIISVRDILRYLASKLQAA